MTVLTRIRAFFDRLFGPKNKQLVVQDKAPGLNPAQLRKMRTQNAEKIRNVQLLNEAMMQVRKEMDEAEKNGNFTVNVYFQMYAWALTTEQLNTLATMLVAEGYRVEVSGKLLRISWGDELVN